jgi:hypothetical protein
MLLPFEAVEKVATLAAFLTDRRTAGAILCCDHPVMRVAGAARVSIRSESRYWRAHASCSATLT